MQILTLECKLLSLYYDTCLWCLIREDPDQVNHRHALTTCQRVQRDRDHHQITSSLKGKVISRRQRPFDSNTPWQCYPRNSNLPLDSRLRSRRCQLHAYPIPSDNCLRYHNPQITGSDCRQNGTQDQRQRALSRTPARRDLTRQTPFDDHSQPIVQLAGNPIVTRRRSDRRRPSLWAVINNQDSKLRLFVQRILR